MSELEALQLWNEHFHREWPEHDSSNRRIMCLAFFGILGIVCSFLVPWIVGISSWDMSMILLLRIPGALLGIIVGMTIVAAYDYYKKRRIIQRFQEKYPDAYHVLTEAAERRISSP